MDVECSGLGAVLRKRCILISVFFSIFFSKVFVRYFSFLNVFLVLIMMTDVLSPVPT